MAAIEPLADFPAGVARVQTMADGSPRFVFDAGEHANQYMTLLARCHAEKRYLRLIIYDEGEFKAALREKVNT